METYTFATWNDGIIMGASYFARKNRSNAARRMAHIHASSDIWVEKKVI
jgi:hypothetical protein